MRRIARNNLLTAILLAIGILLASLAACSVLGSDGQRSAGGLATLSIGAHELHPAFSTDQRDYSTPCNASFKLFVIDAQPVNNDAEVVTDPIGMHGVVAAKPDEVVTITVRAEGKADEHYYVRCLPPDFPSLRADMEGDGPEPGYYLTALGWNDPDKRFWLVILDERGAVVWYKRSEFLALDFKVHPTGNIGWVTAAEAGYSEISERQLDSTILASWRHGNTFTDGHDNLLLPNGNMILGGVPTRADVDVSALAPHFSGPRSVIESWLREVTPDGTVVWEWKTQDHIAIAETIVTDANKHDTTNANRVDLTHWNSLDLDDDGNLLISLRNTDGVYKIRRNPGGPDDGEIIWKLGGTPPTTPGAVHLQLIGDDLGGPVRQHDARYIDRDANLVSIYDNRTLAPEGGSRGVVYKIDEDAGTATLVSEWPKEDGRFTCCFGSVRLTDHGSTVIAWSTTSPIFTEFGRDGTKLLELWEELPPGTRTHGIYRVAWVPADTFDRDELRNTAGGNAQLTSRTPPPDSEGTPATTGAPE